MVKAKKKLNKLLVGWLVLSLAACERMLCARCLCFVFFSKLFVSIYIQVLAFSFRLTPSNEMHCEDVVKCMTYRAAL